MRPDRIVVGEVRQEECLDLLLALNSGVPGLATVHANSARDAVAKLCTLPLLAAENVTSAFVVPTVAATIDLVVFVSRDPSGHRAVTEITAIPGRCEDGVIEVETIFRTQAGELVRGEGFPAAHGTLRPGRPRRHRAARRAPRAPVRAVGDERSRGAALMGALVGLGFGVGVLLIWTALHPARADAALATTGAPSEDARPARPGGRRGRHAGRARAELDHDRTGRARRHRALRRSVAIARRVRAAGGVRADRARPTARRQAPRGAQGGLARRGRSHRFGDPGRAVAAGSACPARIAVARRRCAGRSSASARTIARPDGSTSASIDSRRRSPTRSATGWSRRFGMARQVGGSELGRLLRTLSAFLRADARTRGEIEARQSWTVNAAAAVGRVTLAGAGVPLASSGDGRALRLARGRGRARRRRRGLRRGVPRDDQDRAAAARGAGAAMNVTGALVGLAAGSGLVVTISRLLAATPSAARRPRGTVPPRS